MALSPTKLRVEAAEIYEQCLREELRRAHEPVSLYRERFEGTSFEFLYKRRRAVLRPAFWPYIEVANDVDAEFVRSPDRWHARGYSIPKLVWSLTNHLFCRYRLPYFWLAEWLREEDERSKMRLHAFTQIGRGMSVYKLSKWGILGIVLSRKECHVLQSMHGVWGLGAACRMAQVVTRGGPRTLGHAIARCPWGEWPATPELEARRDRAITWMCGQPGITQAEVDTVAHAVDRWATLDLKGRSLASTRTWIREHRRRRIEEAPQPRTQTPQNEEIQSLEWPSCGLQPRQAGRRPTDAWSIQELNTLMGLHREGWRMRHCVADYARDASQGACSIWSLRVRGFSVLTLEVRSGRIVQIRGKHNREPSRSEMSLVRRWANDNGLAIEV